MKTVCSFFTKFASLISWTLSCFDRIIFKGHLPISRASEFERFVDYVLKIRRDEFLKNLGPNWSERLVDHSKQFDKLERILTTVTIKPEAPAPVTASIPKSASDSKQ